MLRQRRVIAALAGMTGACAALEGAFAPAPNPRPVPRESRVRRDGRLLRIYGASLKSKAEAEADAARAFAGPGEIRLHLDHRERPSLPPEAPGNPL